jgi:8-oxo-dGTP pyrophosphatase MutT (NUDIX family)
VHPPVGVLYGVPASENSEPISAATVVLVRDGDDGIEVLLLQRGDTRVFGGMWVFPGGRVDPEDFPPEDPNDLPSATRAAAVRESAEEVGLVVDPAGLVPLSHWLPPPIAPKRYSTWFFLAPAPAGTVVVDGGEIMHHEWLTPPAVLQRHATGEIALAPPTWVTLHQLGEHASVADALTDATARDPIPYYETHMARVEGRLLAMWSDDAGYENDDPAAPGPRHRLYMDEGGWIYERS